MKIIGIVAVGKNFEIGKNNSLLFELPEDMKHFRQITSNHFVVMGVNTLKSLPGGKPLKNRITICIDQQAIPRDGCLVVSSTEECLKLMTEVSAGSDTEFYICGGAYCYKEFLPYYDRIIVTKVNATDKEATAFFPNLSKNKNFKIIDETSYITDGSYKTKYITYERIEK